ncbi:MAG: alpha/beta hydrolase [Chloroflexota bacterium]
MNNTWFSETVSVNGIALHYTRTGGNGRSLICLHGITDNGLCWTRFAQAMQAEFDVIMVDARGHGRSEAPATGYSPQDHADDAAGLIQHLSLVNPILIGHSMGGMTAAQFVVSYPTLAKAAILEDPPWLNPEIAPILASGNQGWRDQLAKDQQRPVEAFLADGKQENPTWDEIEFPAWAESKKQVSLNVFGILSAESYAAWPHLVAQFKVPVLLLTAVNERGAIIQPTIAQQATSLSPNLHHHHIKNAGHSIRREQFEAYETAVRAFIAKVDGGNG